MFLEESYSNHSPELVRPKPGPHSRVLLPLAAAPVEDADVAVLLHGQSTHLPDLERAPRPFAHLFEAPLKVGIVDKIALGVTRRPFTGKVVQVGKVVTVVTIYNSPLQ